MKTKNRGKPTLLISSKPKKKVYEPKMLVTIYRLAKEGYNNTEIADIMGVKLNTFQTWVGGNADVKEALLQGRSADSMKASTIMDDMYDRLPDHLKPVWDEIMQVDKSNDMPVTRLEKMLEECGRRGRQNLFLYALVHNNYQVGPAMKMVRVKKTDLNRWLQDEGFAELFDQITVQDKKDFFESALIELVKQGHPAAVLFANRTANADRGYAPTKKVHHKHDHSGQIASAHAVVDVASLPLEDRIKVLEAIRNGRKPNQPQALTTGE